MTRSWVAGCSRLVLALAGPAGLFPGRVWGRRIGWGLRIGYRVLLSVVGSSSRAVAGSVPPLQIRGGTLRPRPRCPYDAETRRWANNVLEHGRLAPPFPRHDPEAPHDCQRLRGVLPLLAELYRDTGSAAVWARIEQLLRQGALQADARPEIGWDTTTTALRLLGLLSAAQALEPDRLVLPGMGDWLRNWILAHEPVLRLGAAVEPAGNHRAINVAGRAALHLLLRADRPLDSSLATELVEVFRGQFLPDGGHVEHSPHYHLQTLSVLQRITDVDAGRNGGLRGRVDALTVRPRVALAAMLGPGGAPLRWGDVGRTFSGKLAVAEAREVLRDSACEDNRSVILPDFGLASYRWRAGTTEFRLAADFGALGLAGNPGHGHADALAFALHVDGHELVTDPGTYLYSDDADSMWFKLPDAHSTVRWLARPSHVLSRFFRWRRAPLPPLPVPKTTHRRWAFGALQEWRWGISVHRHHRRWIPRSDGLLVLDTISSTFPEPVVARWSLSPDSDVRTQGASTAAVVWNNGRVEVKIRGNSATSLQLCAGWYASHYGVRQPAPALEVPLAPCRIHTLRTHFRVLG